VTGGAFRANKEGRLSLGGMRGLLMVVERWMRRVLACNRKVYRMLH
jgi:hypothetical protein